MTGAGYHKPVMVRETVSYLLSNKPAIIVDCTVGDGGHSLEILSRSADTFVIGIDIDGEAVQTARERLGSRFSGRCIVTRGDYRTLPQVLGALGCARADGLLYDLGVSSRQLDQAERGFSYRVDAPLDMRMDRDSPVTAKDILMTYSEAELEKLIREYGEERYSRSIAREIVRCREAGRLETTQDLVNAVLRAIPGRWHAGGHPARRTFQAIRIATNDELSRLGPSLEKGFWLLSPGGILAVLSYHSLEDRVVKRTFKALEDRGLASRLTPKALTPSEEEIRTNPRARSAKLRVLQRNGSVLPEGSA